MIPRKKVQPQGKTHKIYATILADIGNLSGKLAWNVL